MSVSSIRSRLLGASLLALSLCGGLSAAWADAPRYGTYLKPFSANSLWNSRPVNPTLGTYVIPKSSYYPSVGGGNYSTGVFLASTSDPPVTIVGPDDTKGVWDPDAEASRASITLPHWPADVIPASASDGHADVVDEANNVIHSFWKLRNDNGTWRAAQYAWSRLDGRGWADPGHYFQGARAAGVPTSAGLIRKHEVNDGDTMYRHVLAMSLTYNALSARPSFVFPATSGDAGAETQNSGQIPEGGLVMLPKDFDLSRITNAKLRKVAETLKTYGAFVVDRNTGTPFVIYVENGADFALHPPGGWDNQVAAQLDLLRASLRPVMSVESWQAPDGTCFQPSDRLNLIALRGQWLRYSGGAATARYDGQSRELWVSAADQVTTLRTTSNRAIQQAGWTKPKTGTVYRFKVKASGGVKLRLEIVDTAAGRIAYNTGYLADGQTAEFPWPADSFQAVLYLTTVAGQEGRVSASLIAKP